MNRLIACALLGFGLASSVVGCSDDDDTTPEGEAGSSAGGTSSAGKNAGGSSAQAGSNTTAGKGGSGAGTAGTGGKTSGGSGGTGGDAGANVGGESLGGEPGVGGENMGGAGGAGGEDGDPTEPPQTANPYWLNKFCDSHAAETVECSNAKPWNECYGQFYPYLSDMGGGGLCANETDMDNFPLTLGLIDALDNLAAKCPHQTEADWSCDLQGTPQPKDQACKDANDAARTAAVACDY